MPRAGYPFGVVVGWDPAWYGRGAGGHSGLEHRGGRGSGDLARDHSTRRAEGQRVRLIQNIV